jgi:hypothetical protein
MVQITGEWGILPGGGSMLDLESVVPTSTYKTGTVSDFMAEVSQPPRHNLLARFASGSEACILTAMVSLLGGNLWLFRERELLLGHFYRPEILSLPTPLRSAGSRC